MTAPKKPKSDIYEERKKSWETYDGHPIEMITGAKLFLNPACEYSRKRYVYRKSEVEEIDLMRRIVSPGDTVIDVGSNIGYWSMCLSQAVDRFGHVFSFEPNPNTFAYLKKNIDHNKCRNVRVFNSGLGNEVGTARLFLNQGHSGDDRMYHVSDGNVVRPIIEVDITSLDKFLEDNQDIDIKNLSFIKIDVQGFEVQVIEGAFFAIKDSLPKILIEYDPESWCAAGNSIESFFYLCNRLGYSLFDFEVSDQNVEYKRLRSIGMLNAGRNIILLPDSKQKIS